MANKIVKCKTCGEEIAKSAKICQKCGAKQKKHTVLGIVLVLIGILILAAVFGGNSDNGPKKVGDVSSDKSQAGNQSTSNSKPEEQTTFGIGEKVSLNDIVVTLVDVKESNGAQFMEPTDGNVFIVCEFEIENNSEKEIAISSMLSFDAYIDDYSASINLSAMVSSDKSQLDGTVAAGKKMNGIVGYEGAKDWESIEIRFTPNFWSGKEITFIAEK